MNAQLCLQSDGNGQAIISLSVPAANGVIVADAIKGMMMFAGYKVRSVDTEGEEVLSADEVFSDACPAMALRGFRGKMEWTQQELAEKLGTTQNCISDMESGKRPISKAMAVRLGEIFNISYKAFL